MASEGKDGSTAAAVTSAGAGVSGDAAATTIIGTSAVRYVPDVTPEITVALLKMDRKRGGFLPEWGAEMYDRIVSIMERQAFNTFVPSGPKIVDDESLRAAVAECERAHVDVAVVVQPTISDGRLAPVLAQVWNGPLVLWATPEKQEGSMISSNSLVGTHLFGASLSQLGRKFEVVYGNLDWDLAEEQLQRGVHVAYAARMIRRAKLCLIGTHAPGFVDLHPHPDVLNKTFGTQLLQVNLAEFLDAAAEFADERKAETDADVAKVEALKLPTESTREEGLEDGELATASRCYLAIKRLVDESSSDCVAIRCWPELPTKFGQWPYMALSRLATEGLPTACEGDTDGALGGLVAKLLGLGASYLSDWLEHDHDTITLWHGGFCPFQLNCAIGDDGGPCVARHFNNHKAGVLDSTIRPGMKVTMFRFWVCAGKYHITCVQGTTEKPKRHLQGNNGLVRVDGVDVVDYFERLLHNGMPHHLCIVEGHHRRRLMAFVRNVGDITVIE